MIYFHSLMVPSPEALARTPLGRTTSDRTHAVWPVSVWRYACVSVLHSLIVPSPEALGSTPLGRTTVILPNWVLASWFIQRHHQVMEHGHTSVPPYTERTYHFWHVSGTVALPNGVLASGSFDHTIKLWSTDTQACLDTLTGHTQSVLPLSIDTDFVCPVSVWRHACVSMLHSLIVWSEPLARTPLGRTTSDRIWSVCPVGSVWMQQIWKKHVFLNHTPSSSNGFETF